MNKRTVEMVKLMMVNDPYYKEGDSFNDYVETIKGAYGMRNTVNALLNRALDMYISEAVDNGRIK